MKHFLKILVVIVVVIQLFSCAPTRIVKPLPAKQKTVGATFGGPLLHFAGAIVPFPLTSLYGAYGIDSTNTLFGGLHTTSLAFADLHLDIGVVHNVYTSSNAYMPNISLSPTFNFIYAFRDGERRFYPQIDINFYWERTNKLFYFTSSNWFILDKTKAHGELQQQHWLPTFNLGTFLRLHKKVNYQIELRYLAPFTQNNSVVDYLNINNHGAFGIYFGMNIKL